MPKRKVKQTLKKEYREKILSNNTLRGMIADELGLSTTRTIERWCVANNPRLTAKAILNLLRKELRLKSDDEAMLDYISMTDTTTDA